MRPSHKHQTNFFIMSHSQLTFFLVKFQQLSAALITLTPLEDNRAVLE